MKSEVHILLVEEFDEQAKTRQTNIQIQGPDDPIRLLGILDLARAKIIEQAFSAPEPEESAVVKPSLGIVKKLTGG